MDRQAGERRPWRRYADVATVLSGLTDEMWSEDRDLIDDTLNDPWETDQQGSAC